MKEFILNNLIKTENLFHKNELAYLALTSKIESPIRDNFAYQLHTALKDKYQISREWNRTDIAILKENSPIVLIELKAMYSFDALIEKNLLKYREKIKKDLIKSKKLVQEDTLLFFILLATHPLEKIESQYQKVVKYSYDINKALKSYSIMEIKELANNNVTSYFNDFNCILKKEFNGGKSFGIETNVLYWVFQEKR